MINSIILNRTEIKYILFQSGSGPFPGKTWETHLEKQKKEKRNMKRTLSLLLAFVMVLGLAACGGNTAQETTAAATAASEHLHPRHLDRDCRR